MNRFLPAFAVALAALPVAASAQAADPAIPTIDALDSALIGAMKAGKTAGSEGRYRKLIPAVERAFDLPVMTRFAVGTAWSGYSAADQAALVKAFTRLSAANFAHNFDSYDGEQFKIDPQVQTRGVDKLVKTKIVPASGAPTDLNYRMRLSSSGTWKVIDVYFGAISQLTAQRSDFAAAAQKGPAALTASMNAKSDQLLK
jgi:phospholipid transport system substrate-binding protein